MDDAPRLATIASLIGDRARAEMLMTLMSGQAQTATELATAANVTKQTASSHLTKLVDAGLLAVEAQGRHRYFRIADRQVARLMETLIGVAQRVDGRPQREFGPRDHAMRKARVCYDHLAGELGVVVFDSLLQRRMLQVGGDGLELTDSGWQFFEKFGVDVESLSRERRPLCRSCLDWSVRRNHLAGALGAATLSRCLEVGWARRAPKSRTLHFSVIGEQGLRRTFTTAK